jgi:plastocyanin
LQKIHRPLIAAAALSCALAPAAQAATKSVDLGLAKPPKGTPEGASLTAFFPRTVKVNVGDKVAFRMNSFGTVLFSKKKPPAFAVPNAQDPVTGAKDPAGNDFWFNGQPSIHVNPFFLEATGDKKITGKGVDHSGLFLGDGPPPPYTVTFTKPGSYKVVNGIQPAITGKVVVVPKGKKVASAAADKARAAKQAAKAVKEAKKLAAAKLPADTLRFGNDSKSVTFYQYFGTQSVKAGQPIKIDAGRFSGDLHNLVIAPIDWLKTPAASPFDVNPPVFKLSGTAIYPSQPPTAPLAFDGTQNGGFVNTGALHADKSTGLPGRTTLTITKPGTYKYVCLFHSEGGEGMSGTLTVTQ